MARFDVFIVDGTYYLDVQTNLLPSTGTRLVVPLLRPQDVPTPVRKLHPTFVISGQPVIMATQLLVAVPQRALGPAVASLHGDYDAIVAAIDMVFNGF